eukprot:TRINITY_DN35052_c0_g1_i8.p1 TRINITY_DN35052_c0_g1~~TRINITY_DN35052_c0_g1_i8.p1  ORF type:complete len:647 (-),score=164.27 TRINITY_DN35052_c0_g1_i8:71-2011(-)
MHSNDGSSASIPTLLVAPAGSRSSKDSKTVKALERNLLTCRRALEQQRMALKQANNENEEGQAAAISKELHRLKVQQVRLAAALWRAVDQEHPEPEVDLAQVDHLEAELRLVRRRIEDRRLVCEEAREEKDVARAEAAERDLRRLKLQQVQLASALWHLLAADSEEEGESVADLYPGALADGGMNTQAKGGKGSVPMLLAGKGKSKGKTKALPIGRRFHWKDLNAERCRGTIFDGGRRLERLAEAAEAPRPVFNLETLQSLFEADVVGEEADANCSRLSSTGSAKSTRRGSVGELLILTSARAQHVAVVLHRLFGRAPTLQDMHALAADIESMQLSIGRPLDAEDIELLASVLPTKEEASALLEAIPERLRRIDRLLIPLASIRHAEPLVRALRLEKEARIWYDGLRLRLGKVADAARAIRSSSALRQLLVTVAQLGSWINAADLDAQRGFALSSALDKLQQFRCPGDDRGVSLLHVVAVAAARGFADGPRGLSAALQDLDGLQDVAKEDLKALGAALDDFKAEGTWLLAQADAPEEEAGHNADVRTRFADIYHDEFRQRSASLDERWTETRAELEALLSFFAEKWGDESSQATSSLESSAQHLLETVKTFSDNIQAATKDVTEQPSRFEKVFEVVCGSAAASAAA